MADRVKYFLLGLLFLVVAGVIAYDRWNSDPMAPGGSQEAGLDAGSVEVGPSQPATPPNAGGHGLAVGPGGDFEDGPDGIDLLPPFPPYGGEATTPPAPVPTPGPDNVRPPAPAPTPEPAPRPEPRSSVHVVQSGETLEVIALQYYKTRDGIAWIAEANGIRDVNRIMAKQKLIIPARNESVRSGRRAAEPARTATGVPDVYVVKAGEDLYDICRKFYGTKGEGARVARIMELNHLWSADVRTGTKLRLPPE